MIFLSLGTNIGDKQGNIQVALNHLARYDIEVLQTSHLYHTPPWGIVDQEWFINAVCQVAFSGTAETLLEIVLRIEKKMGRIRTVKNGPRTIDIDLLEFHREIHDTPDLKLPHPLYPSRAFILRPFCDLSPHWIPTGYQNSVKDLLAQIPHDEIQKVE